jgi:hypothetical protein
MVEMEVETEVLVLMEMINYRSAIRNGSKEKKPEKYYLKLPKMVKNKFYLAVERRFR